ncbi:hypothetical protein [Kribbella sp. NPDC023855]|uniref:hypothetical protein n=1 Tax=Kribbella sp. NPDC023855 TaxID=3154698 RepID=UPI0033D12058
MEISLSDILIGGFAGLVLALNRHPRALLVVTLPGAVAAAAWAFSQHGDARLYCVYGSAALACFAVRSAVELVFRRRPGELQDAAVSFWRRANWSVIGGLIGLTLLLGPQHGWAVVVTKTIVAMSVVWAALFGVLSIQMWRRPLFGAAFLDQRSRTFDAVSTHLLAGTVTTALLTPMAIGIQAAPLPLWVRQVLAVLPVLLAFRAVSSIVGIRRVAARFSRYGSLASTDAMLRDLAATDPTYRLLPGLLEKPPGPVRRT